MGSPKHSHGIWKLAAKSGMAIELRRGQRLRIIDLNGGQVCDLVCFNHHAVEESISSARSIDYKGCLYFSAGDLLYSNSSNPMLRIVGDTVGRHDFLFAPCSQKMFEMTYKVDGPHPNCLDNLSQALAPYNILTPSIPVAFNIFMNAAIKPDGIIDVLPPISRPGDHVEFVSEMDLIVGLSACPAYKANDYRFGPLQVERAPQDKSAT